jgi:hypothetical protein
MAGASAIVRQGHLSAPSKFSGPTWAIQSCFTNHRICSGRQASAPRSARRPEYNGNPRMWHRQYSCTGLHSRGFDRLKSRYQMCHHTLTFGMIPHPKVSLTLPSARPNGAFPNGREWSPCGDSYYSRKTENLHAAQAQLLPPTCLTHKGEQRRRRGLSGYAKVRTLGTIWRSKPGNCMSLLSWSRGGQYVENKAKKGSMNRLEASALVDENAERW